MKRQTWNLLPPSPQYYCQSVAMNNQLVLLGGREAASHGVTNLVSTWTGQDWQQALPPMPTKRARPGVITYHTFVVVAGGVTEDKQTVLSSIDILDITTRQWWTPLNLHLPQPMYAMQFTISSTHLCVTGARISYNAATCTGTISNAVWQLPVTALKKVLATGDNDTSHEWTESAPTPYKHAALLPHTDHIVAVCGRDDSNKASSDVFIYNPVHSQWSKVGQLTIPRTRCAAVSLSGTSFIVCGGCTDTKDPRSTCLTSVEAVHLQLEPLYY